MTPDPHMLEVYRTDISLYDKDDRVFFGNDTLPDAWYTIRRVEHESWWRSLLPFVDSPGTLYLERDDEPTVTDRTLGDVRVNHQGDPEVLVEKTTSGRETWIPYREHLFSVRVGTCPACRETFTLKELVETQKTTAAWDDDG